MSMDLEVISPIHPPTTNELDAYMRQAEMMARSGLVPAAYRGKPADVLVAALTGRELGMAPIAAMQYVVVIQGKPTLNAEGRVALIRKHGHSITGSSGPERAVVTGKRRDTGDEMTVEWTIAMANRAGLMRNDTWKKYPEAMLWARAVSQLSRMLFADVFLGVSYDPSELEELHDDGPPPSVELVRGPDPVAELSVTGQAVDTETGEVVDVVEHSDQGAPVLDANPHPPREPSAPDKYVGPSGDDPDEAAHRKRMAALHASLHEAFALPAGKGRADKEAAAKDTLLASYKVESASDLTVTQVSSLIDVCKSNPSRVRKAAGLGEPVEELAG